MAVFELFAIPRIQGMDTLLVNGNPVTIAAGIHDGKGSTHELEDIDVRVGLVPLILIRIKVVQAVQPQILVEVKVILLPVGAHGALQQIAVAIFLEEHEVLTDHLCRLRQ